MALVAAAYRAEGSRSCCRRATTRDGSTSRSGASARWRSARGQADRHDRGDCRHPRRGRRRRRRQPCAAGSAAPRRTCRTSIARPSYGGPRRTMALSCVFRRRPGAAARGGQLQRCRSGRVLCRAPAAVRRGASRHPRRRADARDVGGDRGPLELDRLRRREFCLAWRCGSRLVLALEHAAHALRDGLGEIRRHGVADLSVLRDARARERASRAGRSEARRPPAR